MKSILSCLYGRNIGDLLDVLVMTITYFAHLFKMPVFVPAIVMIPADHGTASSLMFRGLHFPREGAVHNQ
jgi:hypothetical protein